MTEKEQKKKARAEEIARLRKAHVALLKRVAEEGTVKVKFTSIEDPRGTYDFIWPVVSAGKKYRMVSGLQYDLPPSFIEHLNSLMVPDPQIMEDPVTRQIKPVLDEKGQVPRKNRFSVMPLKMNLVGTHKEEAAQEADV
jgi:hypothetical protein